MYPINCIHAAGKVRVMLLFYQVCNLSSYVKVKRIKNN